jgi:FAD/FMN-containing dehydrogenase
MIRRWPRRLLLCLGLVLIVAIAALLKPVLFVADVLRHDLDERPLIPPGHTDDASRLNLTKVREIWPIPADPNAAEQQLRELLQRAKREGLRISIAGTRHSMGGHTIYPDGMVIDMLPFHHMELDESRNLLRVQAGARWSQIIPYLDARGRSVGVMQSDNTFSVGGSLSVNCHGWQFDRPPICSTVESLRIMTADGQIVLCSRDENQDLFSLALGGYGLFGIILEANPRVVPNERYRLEQVVVPIDDSLATFREQVTKHDRIRMVYARMNVVPERMLDDVILNLFTVEPAGPIPELTDPELIQLRRSIFRGSAESDYGKQLRWVAETRLQPYLSGRSFSRNQLLNEGSDIFQNRTADTTDILHEYFVPQARVAEFVPSLRRILGKHRPNLLNVTVREVNQDQDTWLRYADQDMFSFVMLFQQARTSAAEQQMGDLSRELIDAVLNAGGRYYLPYRLHATPEQFHRAYPTAHKFFELKRHYDPDELFQNEFYRRYGP